MLTDFRTCPSLKLSHRQQLPECSAIYFAVARDLVLYIGLANNLKNRWQNHHRLPQLAGINKRCEVRLFWLECNRELLIELERQYIEYYCPTLNQTKVPERQILPGFKMLSTSLQKLNERVIGFGSCPATDRHLKTLVIGYLADYRETRGATTTLRTILRAINARPNSLFRWTEVVKRRDGAHWLTRCNGIEIHLIPWFEERLMHNPSMYEVMEEIRFGAWTSMPMTEYEAIRQEVRKMPFLARLELARNSEIGRKLFPLECGARFCPVSGVEILCLTESQLPNLLLQHPHLHERYIQIQSLESDPIPKLEF